MQYKYKIKYEFTKYPKCIVRILSNEEYNDFNKAYLEMQKEIERIIAGGDIKIKLASVEKTENDNVIGFKQEG